MNSDVMFVIHNTEEMGRNWTYTRQLFIDLAKGVLRPNEDNRVGLITFAQDATLQWDLESKPVLYMKD